MKRGQGGGPSSPNSLSWNPGLQGCEGTFGLLSQMPQGTSPIPQVSSPLRALRSTRHIGDCHKSAEGPRGTWLDPGHSAAQQASCPLHFFLVSGNQREGGSRRNQRPRRATVRGFQEKGWGWSG